jgi:hypothetical protein
MEHLNRETLARLVDEPPERNEAHHLEECAACREELRALDEQTRALGELPDLLPPVAGWASVEARLREEGLIRAERNRAGAAGGDGPDSGSGGHLAGPLHFFGAREFRARALGAGWRGIAAALVLFLGGAALGAGAMSGIANGGGGGLASALPGSGDAPAEANFVAQAATLDEAVEGVRRAEEQYVSALNQYRQLLEQSGEGGYDPISRFAALDALVAASQAAVREAPTDPFLNGMLLSTVAERQATLRRISYGNDNWY